MAITKNALIRYKILDQCFRNPSKRYYINDLIRECEKVLADLDPSSNGISLRTIRNDIAFMKSNEGWNIELGDYREGKRMYYRYNDPTYSINNMPLNELEVNQLQSAIQILSQFKGMPQFEWMNELLTKLKHGSNHYEDQVSIMDFESNNYLKGIDFLGELYNAILYKKVLSVLYRPFENAEANEVIIHPYFLKQYSSRWFLFGYSPFNEKYNWNLAIDRIESIDEIRQSFHENTEIDWSEYFEDIIGVTKIENAPVENIVLHFYGRTGNYIETKPIHESQKSKWIDEDVLEVRIKVIRNFELERLILSYGSNVKVIEPLDLAKIIDNIHINAHELYLIDSNKIST
ncbi:MAG: WYL domain-containing protein [Bacteroidia bacterium]|nr:WYL domain-containing protein [Bacteroidia bacterium]